MASGMACLIGLMLLEPSRILTSALLATPAGTKAPTGVTFSAACLTLRGRHEYVFNPWAPRYSKYVYKLNTYR